MASTNRAQEKFRDSCLMEHNLCRQKHGAGPLRHSTMLDKSAQDWADHLIGQDQLANSQMSTRGEVGENISMRTSTGHHVDLAGKEVVNQWYNDHKNYNFETGTGPAGNFTQLVWIDTFEVGFGKAHKPGKCIVVAHYRSPGNVLGRYLENVRPSGSQSIVGQQSHAEEIIVEHAGPRKTKETIATESCVDEDGRVFELKRKTIQYMDDDGNVTEKVEESRTYDTGSGSSSPEEDPCRAIDDEEFAKTLEKKKPQPEKSLSPLEQRQQQDLRRFRLDCVDAHNAYRSRHGVGRLKLNMKMSDLAQTWAESMVMSQVLSNSGYTYKGDRLGENIGSRWSNGPCDYAGQEVAEHWYSEEKKFNYKTEPSSVQGIGNFSQIIWKTTKEVGIGKAVLNRKGSCKVVVVAHYHPCGNVLQYFLENVPKPI